MFSLIYLKNSVEFVALVFIFVFNFGNSVTSNLIIYKTCYVTLGYNKTDCALLGSGDDKDSDLEELVEPTANILLMAKSIVETIFPSLLCLLLGPWSDKYGRKPIILLALGGYLCYNLTLLINCWISNLSPWFILSGSAFFCVTGGFPALYAAFLSYITDITTEETRGARLGVLEIMVILGIVLGTPSSSFIFEEFGYVTVYLTCVSLLVIAMVFTLFLLPESVQETQLTTRYTFVEIGFMKENFTTIIKSRESYGRALLLMSIFLNIIFVIPSLGSINVMFLFVREALHWSLKEYTIYTAASFLAIALGTFLGTYVLHRLFKIRETALICFALIFTSVSFLMLAFSSKDWQVYFATGLKTPSGIVSPMSKSLISKLVSSEEIGKIFSIMTAFEALASFIIGSPIFTLVYNSTISTMPSAFNFVAFGICVFEVLLIGSIICVQKCNDKWKYSLIH